MKMRDGPTDQPPWPPPRCPRRCPPAPLLPPGPGGVSPGSATFAPSVSRSAPSVTTVSPSASPSVIWCLVGDRDAELHLALGHRAVALEHPDERAVGAGLDRGRGHRHGLLYRIDRQPDIDELARIELETGVRKARLALDRTGGGVDLVVGASRSCRCRVSASACCRVRSPESARPARRASGSAAPVAAEWRTRCRSAATWSPRRRRWRRPHRYNCRHRPPSGRRAR